MASRHDKAVIILPNILFGQIYISEGRKQRTILIPVYAHGTLPVYKHGNRKISVPVRLALVLEPTLSAHKLST